MHYILVCLFRYAGENGQSNYVCFFFLFFFFSTEIGAFLGNYGGDTVFPLIVCTLMAPSKPIRLVSGLYYFHIYDFNFYNYILCILSVWRCVRKFKAPSRHLALRGGDRDGEWRRVFCLRTLALVNTMLYVVVVVLLTVVVVSSQFLRWSKEETFSRIRSVELLALSVG